jgi:hypothetical protein
MQSTIRQDKIVGSRRFSNYFWSFFCWRLGFLLAGISSYFKVNLLPFTIQLVFFTYRFSDVLWIKFRVWSLYHINSTFRCWWWMNITN